MIPEMLRCLLTKDAETQRWLAHCLDLAIVTSAKDEDVAWDNLKSVVRLHVEHCFTHWQEGLTFRASENEIAVFEALKKKQKFCRTDKITFNLIPPQATECPPLWMEGVELTEGAVSVLPESVAVQ